MICRAGCAGPEEGFGVREEGCPQSKLRRRGHTWLAMPMAWDVQDRSRINVGAPSGVLAHTLALERTRWRPGAQAGDRRRGGKSRVRETGCQSVGNLGVAGAGLGGLGLRHATPRSVVNGPTVASSRCDRDSVPATRKRAKIQHGGPQRQRGGFRVQQVLPNPEPLCLLLAQGRLCRPPTSVFFVLPNAPGCVLSR